MIGLIPAAGHAERLQGLPKFLLPVGNSYLLHILIQRMCAAGCSKVYIGANSANFDLVCRYAPGCQVYCVDSATMSETVLAARSYINIDEDVLFAMPDCWWRDETLLPRLASRLNGISVCAGLWYTHRNAYRLGMCEVTGDGGNLRVTEVIDKPALTSLRYSWGSVAWRRSFWQCIAAADAHVGFALQRAIDAHVHVAAVTADGSYHDCGEPGAYYDCVRDFDAERVKA